MRRALLPLILVSAVGVAVAVDLVPARAEEPQPGDLRASVLAVVNDDEALGALFRGLVDLGDDRGILVAAETVIAERETSVLGWQYRGYAAQRLGSATVARRAYERCVELDDTNWWAMTQLGHLLTEDGEFDPAVRHLSRAVALMPEVADGWRKLVLAERLGGLPRAALASAREAEVRRVDPQWVHAEVATLCWELGRYDESLESWDAAETAGADAAEVRRGRELVAFDRSSVGEADPGEVLARRLGEGTPWSFLVGRVRVLTRAGPTLPEPDREFLETVQESHARFLRVKESSSGDIWLHLAQTAAEHETFRRKLYPAGTRGRAFTERPAARLQGSAEPRVRVYLTAPDLHRSIAHELVHALLIHQGAVVPPALEEGLATYLEEPGEGRSRTDLVDLLRDDVESDRLQSWSAMIRLDSTGFTGTFARRRYAQSWSMIHFLLHGTRAPRGTAKTGEARLRELLATTVGPARRDRRGAWRARWEETYGKTEAELEEAWLMYVRKLVRR